MERTLENLLLPICQFCKCSQKNALIYSQPPKLNLASPNSEDDVYIYLRALHWAFYSRKSVKIQIKSKCSLKNSKSKILAAISVTKYAVPEKVVIAAIYDGNLISTETNVQPTYNDVEYCTSKPKTWGILGKKIVQHI